MNKSLIILGLIVIALLTSACGYISTPSKPEDSTNINKKVIVLEKTGCKRDGDIVHMTGFVHNIDDGNHSFIRIKGILLDSERTELNTDTSYVVGSEGVDSNERKSYDIIVPYVEDTNRCEYSVVDYQ